MRKTVTFCDTCKQPESLERIVVHLTGDLRTAQGEPNDQVDTVLKQGDICIPCFTQALEKFVEEHKQPVMRDQEGQDERLQRGDDGATRSRGTNTVVNNETL